MGVPPKTASAFAVAYRPSGPGDDDALQRALDRARGLWEGDDRFSGENDDPWWHLVLGTRSRVEDLNARNGISHFAPRIWGPLHGHEVRP
jgi:exodeoxyribonuclease V gamma subunit